MVQHDSVPGCSATVAPDDTTRRELAAKLLGAVGLLGLASCTATDDAEGTASDDLTGSNTVAYCDSYADLRATAGAANKPIAIVGGYLSRGDGAGGVFYWSTASGLTDDNGLVIVPAGGGGAWVRQFSGAIDARWFGAGLGGDDAAAIQAAVDATLRNGAPWSGAQRATGGIVRIPSGSYFLERPIRIDNPYPPSSPSWVPSISVRIIGDGMYNTFVNKIGPDATCIVFGGTPSAPGQPPADRIRNCEVSNLGLFPADLEHLPTQGAAISFPFGASPNGNDGGGVSIHRIFVTRLPRAIECAPAPGTGFFNNVVIDDIKSSDIYDCGLFASHAHGWKVSHSNFSMASGMSPPQIQPLAWAENTCALWLDAETARWTLNNVGGAIGDCCLRLNNSGQGTRPPAEHHFHECNFDEGGRACIWITAAHRCSFVGCWASSQSSPQGSHYGLENGPLLTGVVVLDGADIRGLRWANGTIVNVSTCCFTIYGGESFSIVDSTFSSWGMAPGFQVPAISIDTKTGMNFMVTGNTFLLDGDFLDQPHPWRGIEVGSSFTANKYLIANNASHGAGGLGGLPGGTLHDAGSAAFGKYLPSPNSNL